ncbi:hypothetical protein CEE37_00820 [candidate division LCP-89 bacterium B3_LCP]|uniref:Uncharacterized protein n=1 Tax=candidate division LCP-89 bacterium B3_LCP TaxID=2012998 RepID=A0A532V538_UNCL8|nr:MAG: hypothetical protein CEE37_00820 [candidate division LCP-89 bacterium B3_LCP]
MNQNKPKVKGTGLRYFVFPLVVLLLLPQVSLSGRLMSFDLSKNSNKDYSILSLHFDKVVSYTVTELDRGERLRLTLPGCQVEPLAAEEIVDIKGKLITGVKLHAQHDALVFDFHFSGRMKPVVLESRDPFSLILDISHDKSAPAVNKKPKNVPQQTVQRKEKIPQNPKSKPVTPTLRKEQKQSVSSEQKSTKSSVVKKKRPPAPVSIIPSSPQGNFLEGSYLRQQGYLSEALEHFEQARRDPDMRILAIAEIASIYHQLGKRKEEVAAWEELFHILKVKYSGEAFTTHSGHTGVATGSRLWTDGHQQSGGQAQQENRSGNTLAVIAFGLVILLSGGMVWFFLKLRRLEWLASLRSLDEEISEEKTETEPKPEPEPKSEPKPQDTAESGESDRGEKPEEEEVPENEPETPEVESVQAEEKAEEEVKEEEEEENVVHQPTEKTAQEVFTLSEQGLSIQEIAEKLGLGQDEVRLILNLQREENVTA